jgi:hypothetical protein
MDSSDFASSGSAETNLISSKVVFGLFGALRSLYGLTGWSSGVPCFFLLTNKDFFCWQILQMLNALPL